jgi:hypothetical protein
VVGGRLLAGWETHTAEHRPRRHINGLGGGAGLGWAGLGGGRLVVSGGWWVVGGRLCGWWKVGWVGGERWVVGGGR